MASWKMHDLGIWDVTVIDTLAESYLQATSSSGGGAAEDAANRKELRYQALAHTHTFIPLAFEIFGSINFKSVLFVNQLGRRLTANTGDLRETAFYFSAC